MSSRIALMVKGLPPIGIDEAIERFGKYYPEPRFGVWHESPSFTGRVENNSVMFTDSQGSLKGGGGLNAQVMADLRKLQSDFNNYTSQYPIQPQNQEQNYIEELGLKMCQMVGKQLTEELYCLKTCRMSKH